MIAASAINRQDPGANGFPAAQRCRTTPQPYSLYSWGGGLRRLPASYRFPARVWELFYFGDRNQHLPPFRTVEFSDFGNSNDATYLSKVRIVVHIIAVLAFKANKFSINGYASNELNVVPVSVKRIDNALVLKSATEMRDIFEVGYNELIESFYSRGSSRSVQVSYSTLHKRVGIYDKQATQTNVSKLSSFIRYK